MPDLAVVGADSLSAGGVVNKLGTALVALAAHRRGVPIYVLCGSEKFLPRAGTFDAALFESTPLAWFTGIVTEDALLVPGAAGEAAARIPVHPDLLKPETV
jgi:methylthioribose-1-phosphate isomerase